MVEPIRILLCEDQTLMREGLHTVLELEEDFQVVGEAIDGDDAIHQFTALRERGLAPDVILMDVQMPRKNGVEATGSILALDPGARIVILTTFDYDDYVFDAVRAGAMGYLLKDVPAVELASTIRKVAQGEPFIQPKVASKLLVEFSRGTRTRVTQENSVSLPSDEILSAREIAVLKLLATGASNREIAEKLVLAEGTVKNHVSNILGKLHAENRTHAANVARERKII